MTVRPYAPGKSRIRLATIPSITSLVPPSIELALVRNQARGRSPPPERPLSPSSAAAPPAGNQDLVAALVQLGAVIFHRRRKRRMRLSCLGEVDRALGGAGQRRLVDLEGRD